ncbi:MULTISPECIES: H-NS family nucleoid-associated regulatory protein [unclassified Variovorax]|uniref:H-NS family nucleoid-associated regulatory protein n=1 Tax=unclassified Variovorax TaxID=663243 RepID=UPI000AFCAA07|nr:MULTISPECIES: H-NS family nucleoid-associated regulatory protein [unclassified Variovorax]
MAQKSYAQIQKQIEALQRQADELRAQEVDGVVARIREAVAHYGLTAEQLGYGGKSQKSTAKTLKTGGKSAPAYSDGLGNTWGGRGPRPRWLRDALAAGRSLEDFASSSGTAPVKAGKAPKAEKTPKKAKGVPAKKRIATAYRDEAGNTWSGFGPKPRWLKEALAAGKTLEQLAATGA